MRIDLALAYGWPGEQWSLDGETYAGLTWLDTTPKPTEAEIEAKWDELQALPPPPRVATARQFKAALALAGLITEAEVSSPDLPAIAESIVASFPLEQRIVARSTWANMTTVPEDDPLLEAMRQAANLTVAQRVALFDTALAIT